MRLSKLIFIISLAVTTQAHAQVDFFEIRDTLSAYKAEKKGKTSAQKSEIERKQQDYIESLTGQTVEWRGWVDDVKSIEHWMDDGVDYTVEIDLDLPGRFFSLADVTFKTQDSAAASLAVDMPVTVSGVIKDINSAGKIALTMNVIKQGHDQEITAEELQAAQTEQEAVKQKQESNRAALKEKYNQIEGQGAQAYVACKNTVKDSLTSPSTAKFPWTGWQFRVLPNGKTATVRSHVDSQNQFGARVRTNFECRMRYLGQGSWAVENVKTNDG